jgi:hypothetical protein
MDLLYWESRKKTISKTQRKYVELKTTLEASTTDSADLLLAK